VAVAASIAAAGGLGASGDQAAATVASDRVTTDMPDDIAGRQVHVIYVVASNGEDRQLDTNGTISRSLASVQKWLRGQTGGRGLRFDTYHGEPDITFARLTGPFQGTRSFDDFRAAGFNNPAKVYAVYLEGSGAWTTCAGGADSFAILLLKAPFPGCLATPIGLDPPWYWEFTVLHELMHVIGFVPACAPHHSSYGNGHHVLDNKNDLMYSGPEPTWQPTQFLDFGHDDYFMAGIPGCSDLSDSPFLESPYSVSVSVIGHGTVTSSPSGIDCPETCTGKFTGTVTLTETPRAGATFKGWTGACSGTDITCVFRSEGSVGASFSVASHGRSLSLRLRGQRVTGSLTVDDAFEPCGSRAPVVVERRGTRGWSSVRKTRTNHAGAFAVLLPKGRATYRTRAPRTTVDGETCVLAVSRPVTSSG
jgi:hypothetical protein